MKLPNSVGAFLLLCTAGMAPSNVLRPIPIDQQASAADVVVVGRIGEMASCEIGAGRVRCAELIVDAVLKGPPTTPGQRRFLLLSPATAEDVEILYVPTNALMFLRWQGGELYAPLYGSRSIFPLLVAG